MALRQKLNSPGFEWQVREELESLKVMRPPKEVEFRRGADPADVVADILPYNHVKLCAAVGSGKSVQIPSALAFATKALVFHVVPSRQLANHLFTYLVKLSQRDGHKVRAQVECYAGDVDVVPRNGVFLISAVDMVDVIMRSGDLSKYKGCSVFLDEAHESDAYTHVVRSVSLHLGAERLVLASATFDPEVHGKRTTPGTVKMTAVDLGNPEDWEVDRVGSPFHAATMRDGVLVFVDSRSAASRLAVAYERAGLDVFRLTSSSSDLEVAKAMAAAKDDKGALFAILADYTYRSGFTFPVSRVVDVGEVSYFDSEPGTYRKLTRRMFQFEKEQAAGRVGRIHGDAEYFYQRGECPAVMCDLDGVEREAAAYIYRCLGFKPDGILRGAFMATHNLPVGLSVRVALNGPYPLTYYVKHSDAAMAAPTNTYVEKSGFQSESFADPPSYFDSQGHEDKMDVDENKRDSGIDMAKDGAGWGFVIDELVANDAALVLQEGTYYISQVRDSLGRGVQATLTFPHGLQSVREFAVRRNFAFAVSALSKEDRMWAFSALLDRYNTILVQVKGVKQAVKEAMPQERSLGFADKVRDVMQDLSADYADAIACLRAAEGFGMSMSWVVPYDGVLKAEQVVKDNYYRLFVDGSKARHLDDLEADVGIGVDARVKRLVSKERDKGRTRERYEGRKKEMLVPSWVDKCKRIIYDEASSKPGLAKDVKVMRKSHGHDDGRDYELITRYTRVTEWY